MNLSPQNPGPTQAVAEEHWERIWPDSFGRAEKVMLWSGGSLVKPYEQDPMNKDLGTPESYNDVMTDHLGLRQIIQISIIMRPGH